MKKLLLFFSATLFALGTAFAQEAVSNEQWQADYNAETKTLTVTVTATQINGADAATGVEGLVGFIWKDAVGSGTNLPVEKSNNGFTMTAAVSNVEATDKVTLIARWEWAFGGSYQAPDYVYGESGGEEPEPAEPVTPTAESYVVTWEAPVYDASAQTLTLSGTIATAENAGFEWSQITGPMVNFIINQGSDVTAGAANVDGKYTATFSNVVAGTQLSYKANIITGANAVVAGSNVTVSDEGWVYIPEGSVEPEPEPVTVSIVAQYLNGNTAFSSTMIVPVATANADGDVDVTCQFYYYSAADEYAQATPVGQVFSDNTEGSLVVEDVDIQASSAFPLPAGTYKFEAVWMYGEEELRTGLSTEVVVPEPEPAETWYITGDGADKDYWCGGKNWDPAGLELTLDGEVYVYSTTVQAGTYNFKITNGGWYDSENNPDGINYGYTNVNSAASTSGYEDGGGNNVRFTVAAEAQITITLDPAAAEDAKITLDSSVDFGQPEITRWTLTGAVPFFVGGGDWSFQVDNDLIQSQENEFLWVKVYSAVNVADEQASMVYEYKLGANGDYNVDQFPTSGNLTFTMPQEAGVYDITFIWDAEQRNIDYEIKGVASNGPDALYIRGDGLGGWMDNTTDPALMNENYLAVTSDNLVYVWDWSDEPVSLVGSFKFGRLQTEDEVSAGTAWGNIVNGAYGAGSVSEISELGKYEITTPGGNFSIADALIVSRIELDLKTMTVDFIYEEPTAIDETAGIAVSASNGRISVDGEFTIVNLAGQDVTAANGSLQGTYIVITGDDAVKVYVD